MSDLPDVCQFCVTGIKNVVRITREMHKAAVETAIQDRVDVVDGRPCLLLTAGVEREQISEYCDLEPCVGEQLFESIACAESVPQVVDAIVSTGIVAGEQRIEALVDKLGRISSAQGVEEARSAGQEMVMNDLVPARQEILRETLRERIEPAITEIGGNRVVEHGSQLVAEFDAGEIVLQPVSGKDGSVRLNVSFGLTDGSCHDKMKRLQESFHNNGVVVSDPVALPKVAANQRQLQTRRLRARRQIRH